MAVAQGNMPPGGRAATQPSPKAKLGEPGLGSAEPQENHRPWLHGPWMEPMEGTAGLHRATEKALEHGNIWVGGGPQGQVGTPTRSCGPRPCL